MPDRNGIRWSEISRAILTDPQFTTLMADRRLLGEWLILYLDADDAWPTPAHLPRLTAQDALDHLVEVGLVILHDGEKYSMPALDQYREDAVAGNRNAGLARVAKAHRDHAGRFLTSPAPAPLGETPAPLGVDSSAAGQVTSGGGEKPSLSAHLSASHLSSGSSAREASPSPTPEPGASQQTLKDERVTWEEVKAQADVLLTGSPRDAHGPGAATAPDELAFADEPPPEPRGELR